MDHNFLIKLKEFETKDFDTPAYFTYFISKINKDKKKILFHKIYKKNFLFLS